MATVAQAWSKLTDGYPTTVPRRVSRQLKPGKGDEIVYATEADGRVCIAPMPAVDSDPALEGFLELIAADIKAHPVFLDQLEALIHRVETRRDRDPATWRKNTCTKRLGAILKRVSEVIPADPGAQPCRQGDTKGMLDGGRPPDILDALKREAMDGSSLSEAGLEDAPRSV